MDHRLLLFKSTTILNFFLHPYIIISLPLSSLPLYTHSEQITKSFSIMQFKVILLSLASAGLAAAQGLTVNTPSSLITCVPTLIQWTGGAGPYYLFAVSAKDLIECADPSSMVPRPVEATSMREMPGSG